MTINGNPVSDSMKNSILNNNKGQVKMMKVIVNGDKMSINDNPLNHNSSIFEEKIIKGNSAKLVHDQGYEQSTATISRPIKQKKIVT
jgi:hypothetical protein